MTALLDKTEEPLALLFAQALLGVLVNNLPERAYDHLETQEAVTHFRHLFEKIGICFAIWRDKQVDDKR